jgi:hypothetical protein
VGKGFEASFEANMGSHLGEKDNEEDCGSRRKSARMEFVNRLCNHVGEVVAPGRGRAGNGRGHDEASVVRRSEGDAAGLEKVVDGLEDTPPSHSLLRKRPERRPIQDHCLSFRQGGVQALFRLFPFCFAEAPFPQAREDAFQHGKFSLYGIPSFYRRERWRSLRHFFVDAAGVSCIVIDRFFV